MRLPADAACIAKGVFCGCCSHTCHTCTVWLLLQALCVDPYRYMHSPAGPGQQLARQA